jgi:hypothetical protein
MAGDYERPGKTEVKKTRPLLLLHSPGGKQNKLIGKIPDKDLLWKELK